MHDAFVHEDETTYDVDSLVLWNGPDGLALDRVSKGHRVVDPARTRSMAARAAEPNLTERELEVLALVVAGRTNPEIGLALTISLGTVRTHVSSILEKLGAASRAEATAIAIRRGLA